MDQAEQTQPLPFLSSQCSGRVGPITVTGRVVVRRGKRLTSGSASPEEAPDPVRGRWSLQEEGT